MDAARLHLTVWFSRKGRLPFNARRRVVGDGTGDIVIKLMGRAFGL